MNDTLVETLGSLRSDPTRAAELYRDLYLGSFIVLVEGGSEGSLPAMRFLTYASSGGQQLPVFTRREFVLGGMRSDSVPVTVEGPALWPRLLEFIGSDTCGVEVDPGQPHGIRLRRDMVLGMVAKYAGSNQ
jgi:hypothetical protein